LTVKFPEVGRAVICQFVEVELVRLEMILAVVVFACITIAGFKALDGHVRLLICHPQRA
jgi:hypothetical protein